jgi:parvulin-like peptidyl-prolyl isomerase
MTFRARSAPRPTRRRVRRSDTRRAIYITLTFTLAIACAISLMGGVFIAGYISSHAAPIAAVNGEVISKDAVRDRAALNLAIYERQIADYTTQRNRGQIGTDDYNTLVTAIQAKEDPSKIYSDAETQLVNEAELRQYAASNSVSISDAAVNAQIQTDATTAEMRHVKIISVTTQATAPASSRTLSDSITALTKANGYLAEIQGGKKWDDVATESKPDNSSTSGANGDIGLTNKDDLVVDPDLADAIFALKNPNDITAVFKGTDGAYRFATVTSITPKNVDSAWQDTIANAAGSDLYRAYARAEATQQAIKDSINAKYVSGATLQHHLQEIAIFSGYGQPGNGDEVKLKMMIFAPSHSMSGASGVATSDPAWADAKSRADAAVAALRKDPSQFATLAEDTTNNDEPYFAAGGGDVPWIPADLFQATTSTQQTGLSLPAVATAVFAGGIADGTIMDPILETAAGYVVVEFQGLRPAPDQRIADAQFAINNGTDFSTEARVASESADASVGGDMGWVSPYQLTPDQERAVAATPVGSVSNMLSGSGFYVVYKVLETQTRVADPVQQAKLLRVVFTRWLTELQSNALVWQDQAALDAMNPSASAAAT